MRPRRPGGTLLKGDAMRRSGWLLAGLLNPLLILPLLPAAAALAQEEPFPEAPRASARLRSDVAGQTQAQRLEPADAAEHVGENVTVCGWVAHASFNATQEGSPTLMWLVSMGVPEPGAIRVVIQGENRERFPQPPEVLYADDFICVSGDVRENDALPLHIEVADPAAVIHPPKHLQGGALHQSRYLPEESAAPERIHYLPLRHTPSMMQAGILGELKIQYAVDETGHVIATRLLRDSLTCIALRTSQYLEIPVPEGSEETIDDAIRHIDATVRQWRYAPTMLDSEPTIAILETTWNADETGIALMNRAAELSNIRAEGSEPFLLRAQARIFELAGGDRTGTYTLAWRSPETWRQQVGFGYAYRDIEIVNEGRWWRENRMNNESIRVEASRRPEELRHLLGFVSRLKTRSEETITGYRLRDEDVGVLECVRTLGSANAEHELCFDSAGALVIEEDEGAANEYADYARLGAAVFPRTMRVFEGEELDSLVVEVNVGTLRQADLDPASFEPPAGAEWSVRGGDEALTAPVQLSNVLPEYTPAATRDGIQGDVYIDAIVTVEGTVESPRLVRGIPDPELNRRALAALLRWRFEPGRKGGRPVPVLALFTITYRIH